VCKLATGLKLHNTVAGICHNGQSKFDSSGDVTSSGDSLAETKSVAVHFVDFITGWQLVCVEDRVGVPQKYPGRLTAINHHHILMKLYANINFIFKFDKLPLCYFIYTLGMK
jgi:hypothetical protein